MDVRKRHERNPNVFLGIDPRHHGWIAPQLTAALATIDATATILVGGRRDRRRSWGQAGHRRHLKGTERRCQVPAVLIAREGQFEFSSDPISGRGPMTGDRGHSYGSGLCAIRLTGRTTVTVPSGRSSSTSSLARSWPTTSASRRADVQQPAQQRAWEQPAARDRLNSRSPRGPSAIRSARHS